MTVERAVYIIERHLYGMIDLIEPDDQETEFEEANHFCLEILGKALGG